MSKEENEARMVAQGGNKKKSGCKCNEKVIQRHRKKMKI